jgi:hypothetical protein
LGGVKGDIADSTNFSRAGKEEFSKKFHYFFAFW